MSPQRRRVAVGETIEMVLAETRTPLMEAIGGEVRMVRVLDGRVQILEPDGVTLALRHEPPFDVVGIHADRRGLWVEPIPERLTQVFRHGTPVSVPMTRSVHAVRWLENHTPWTAVRCLADEGYEIVDIKRKAEDQTGSRRHDGKTTSASAPESSAMPQPRIDKPVQLDLFASLTA